MGELVDALKTRLSSPLLGYFGLALLAINWKAVFYLIVQEKEVLGRIQFFETHTTWASLMLYPLLFAFTFAVLYPWAGLVVAWLTAKPIELRDMLQAKAEHNLIKAKKQLEEARSKLLANAEVELIERAERDEKVDSLQNAELKSRIKSELEELRAQRDSLRGEMGESQVQKRHKELMDMAAAYRAQAAKASSLDDRSRFYERARELEEEAHKVVMHSLSAAS